MYVRNGDLRLHVVSDGDPEAPSVLLIHGITSSHRTWSWFVPALAEHYHVLRLDLRGHGGSGRTPGQYALDGYVSDAAAAVEQAAGGEAIVIGHSLGGATAIALAQRRPELVQALVLEDPPLLVAQAGGAGTLDGNTLMAGFTAMRSGVPRLQQAGVSVDDLSQIIGTGPSPTPGMTFGELVHPDTLVANAGGLLDLDASVLDPVLDGTGRAMFDTSTPITAPTLLVTADPTSPDAVARPAGVAAFESICPDVDVHVAVGAGHLIHDQVGQREPFAERVLGFLDRFDSAA